MLLKARAPANKRGNRGFTLVEALLASTLTVLITLAAFTVLANGFAWWRSLWGAMDAQQNARVALTRVTTEVQEARALLASSDSSNLYFQQQDGTSIWYYRSGSDLRRAVKKEGEISYSGHNPVAYGVQDIAFTYSRPSDPAGSSWVKIRLVTRDEQGKEFKVETAAALRLQVLNPK